ncbi:MAG: SUMF1/EgtB/PvdO family nonheme iron enzyme [Candidatus Omnitrophota bacterium]
MTQFIKKFFLLKMDFGRKAPKTGLFAPIFLFSFCLWSLVFSLWPAAPVLANNLAISNVTMSTRDPANDTFILQFDVSWNNSWRNKINHDAVWLFVKVDTGTAPYSHCLMKTSGASPTGFSAGSDSDLAIYVPTDKMGAFLRPSASQAMGNISTTSVQLKVDYGASSCNIADTASITPYVYGIEMVFVPTGSFYAGDFPTSSSAFRQGSADADPWYITSEGTIAVQNVASDGYYYKNSGYITPPNEFSDGTVFTIPAVFPKGYAAFYAMKYELTEGQWVSFFNTLTTDQKNTLDITGNVTNMGIVLGGKNSDSLIYRNTVSWDSGTPTVAAVTTRGDRAMSYISWVDLCAYLDWAGLRPMTELEYEKLARGPVIPVRDEYAWGSTDFVKAVTILTAIGSEDGAETITTTDGVTHANIFVPPVGGSAYVGGDDYIGTHGASGPLRAGIFATATSDRVMSGAGYYGAMELSGNLKEMVVTVASTVGIGFIGNHGDGALTSGGCYGCADVTGWVQLTGAGIILGSGSGTRGGGWGSPVAGGDEKTISYRGLWISGYSTNTRSPAMGGRGVRTYDGS